MKNPVNIGEALHAQSAVELAIVVPTFKERDNVAQLVRLVDASLRGVAWEIIFVDDDSPDGTAQAIRDLAHLDPRVRCIHRIARRGLSSACVEGALSTSAECIAVMDADLQHDERLLPEMLARLRAEPQLDIVIGSRYVQGGSLGEWGAQRISISRMATRLSHLVLPKTLQDPMSGFFMMRRDSFMGAVRKLSNIGFKILVDLFASSPKPLRFAELPYTFRNRVAGESKLDSQVAWDYFMLLADKTVGHLVPARFLSFALIGGAGVFLHMAVLSLCLGLVDLPFKPAQTVATLCAMVFNYSINNVMTYRDRRRKGLRWWSGLLSFAIACSVGAVANVGIASYLFDHQSNWVLSAISGILIGAVWNYAITSVYTWKRA